jgi:hypothetical protein
MLSGVKRRAFPNDRGVRQLEPGDGWKDQLIPEAVALVLAGDIGSLMQPGTS